VCLALVALDAHPRLQLVIAANRDEFHARAAEPAHWWPDGLLAGADKVAGGTWFGVTAAGRWALVTNFREGVPRGPAAPSRGELVTRAVSEDTPPLRAPPRSRSTGHATMASTSSGRRRPSSLCIEPREWRDHLGAGIYGLSNHLLETPWPKVLRGKARLAAWLASGDEGSESLFELLADRTQAGPAALPSTGVAPEWERLLSSPFIVDSRYGTRCSTVLTIARDGRARFVERSFDPRGQPTGEAAFEFRIRGR
jgi:uncharacterized protein with NRDE domain